MWVPVLNSAASKVEVHADGAKVGEGTSAPYTMTWSGAAVRAHWLTAVAVSAPVQIAVVAADCVAAPLAASAAGANTGTVRLLPNPIQLGLDGTLKVGVALEVVSQGSARASLSLETKSASLQEQSPEIFFAEDVSPHPVFGENQVARPAIPNARRAAALFYARLPGVRTEDFESFAPDAVPTQLKFGTNAVALGGEQAVWEVADAASTAQGQFPVSGKRGLNMAALVGSGLATLDFSAPQAAFGFFGTDIEFNGLSVTLVSVSGERRTLTVPVTRPQGSGGAFFWGVIDRQNPFVRVELERVDNLEDGFLFDDLTIAAPAEVLPEFDFPTVSVADTGIIEGDAGTKSLPVNVTLSHPAGVPVTVELITQNGTATSGADYVSTNVVITFAPGETVKVVSVPIIGEKLIEVDETFIAVLRDPSNVLLGRCRATLTIRNDDDAAPPPNTPPIVSITLPEDGALFAPSTPVKVEVAATDADAGDRIVRVELWLDDRPVGTNSSAPWVFQVPSLKEGSHVFTARAEDSHGATAESQPVHVLVAAQPATVAIVGWAGEPEVVRQREILLQMQRVSRVFAPRDATLDALKPYELIIWCQAGRAEVTPGEVEALRQLRDQPEQGRPLYFIGESLVAAGRSLPAETQQLWFDLLRLVPGNGRAAEALPCFTDESIAYLGAVGDRSAQGDDCFDYRPASGVYESASANGAGSIVLARWGQRDVAVAYPPANQPDLPNRYRSIAQNFFVSTRGALSGQVVRDLAFQGAVCWLLRCTSCDAFNVLFEEPSETEFTVNVGDRVDLALTIYQRRCIARGVHVTAELPPGVVWLDAEADQGQPFVGDQTLDLVVGQFPEDQRLNMVFKARPVQAGTYTVTAHARSIESTAAGESSRIHLIIRATGELPQPRLSIRFAGGAYLLSWPSTASGWRLEFTDKFPAAPNDWQPVMSVPSEIDGKFQVTLPLPALPRFFRLRM